MRCDLWPGPDGRSTCVRAYRTGCIGLIHYYRVHAYLYHGLVLLVPHRTELPCLREVAFLDRAIRSVQIASFVQRCHGLTGGVPHVRVRACYLCTCACRMQCSHSRSGFDQATFDKSAYVQVLAGYRVHRSKLSTNESVVGVYTEIVACL